MNDFTKKELTMIARALVATYSNPKVSLNKPEMDLVNKVESMIDNYCEHEDKHYDENRNFYMCVKCEAVFV